MARGRENDGKYLRLTGLWPSKKDGLFSGKLRPEDISKLLEKADEADKDGLPLVFLLWENTDKRGRKDPDFTLQVTIAEEDSGGRGRSSSSRYGSSRGGRDRDDREEDRDRGRDRGRSHDRDEDDEKEEPEEEQEEERPRSRKSAPAKKPATKGKPVAKKKGKDDDW